MVRAVARHRVILSDQRDQVYSIDEPGLVGWVYPLSHLRPPSDACQQYVCRNRYYCQRDRDQGQTQARKRRTGVAHEIGQIYRDQARNG
jgi:hypothetical protein